MLQSGLCRWVQVESFEMEDKSGVQTGIWGMLSFNHDFWQLGHCKSDLVQPLCPSWQNWWRQTEPTSEEEGTLAVGWSSGSTQQLILVKAAGLPGLGWDEGPGNPIQPLGKRGGVSCSKGGVVEGSQTGQG